MNRLLSLISVIILVLVFNSPVHAQIPDTNPIYIVQSGDTLSGIAQRFGISLDELTTFNNIANPKALQLGTRIFIPGLKGVSGVLVTRPVLIGETLKSLLVKNNISNSVFLKLNRITSPDELFAGANLILPELIQKSSLSARFSFQAGESILESAIQNNTSPWVISLINLIPNPERILPGELIFLPSDNSTIEISSTSPFIKKIEISPLPLVQGKTVTVRIFTNQTLTLTGSLAGNDLHFFVESPNQYIALQGIHALAAPGLSSFKLNITDPLIARTSFEKTILIKTGGYIKEPPLPVDPKTLDPATTKPEEDQIRQITQRTSGTKLWSGKFRLPVDEPICPQSTYGNRRSYNNSPYDYFHSGVDFGVCKTLSIYAPANGVVVFAGPLSVRGNATIIDHGWGVYSGYWHQSEIKVKAGAVVIPGQLIGLVGATGRVTGPHLHWEMIVNGVQVEPLDWLEFAFP